eukprot:scaffold836_cov123-Isochrysis_galbana.AAC.14
MPAPTTTASAVCADVPAEANVWADLQWDAPAAEAKERRPFALSTARPGDKVERRGEATRPGKAEASTATRRGLGRAGVWAWNFIALEA